MKKRKIFGRHIEWYDVKTKFKKLSRGIFYIKFIQNLISYLICGYLLIIYLTSKKKIIIDKSLTEMSNQAKNKAPLILAFWHNRLALSPFCSRQIKQKTQENIKFISISSKHGDGRFVGLVLEKFGFKNIYGSSQNQRKSSRGIKISSLRDMIKSLKQGYFLGITPDGPRGPNQKVNSEIINIAKLANSNIVPIGISAANFIQLDSWDKFKIPLPFSTICYYYHQPIIVNKSDDESYLKSRLEQDLNYSQEYSLKIAQKK